MYIYIYLTSYIMQCNASSKSKRLFKKNLIFLFRILNHILFFFYFYIYNGKDIPEEKLILVYC